MARTKKFNQYCFVSSSAGSAARINKWFVTAIWKCTEQVPVSITQTADRMRQVGVLARIKKFNQFVVCPHLLDQQRG